MKWGIGAAAMCLACGSALGSATAVSPAAAPAAAGAGQELVAEDGRRLAFDDSAADGGHAIRVYDAQGKLVRELDLADFLPKEYVGALPHDAAGLHWRREAAVTKDAVEFSVPVPGSTEGQALQFSVDLDDGLVRTAQIREYLAAADQARALSIATR